jgi:hypothetical protein
VDDERVGATDARQGAGGRDEAEADGTGHGVGEAEAVEVDEVADDVGPHGKEVNVGVGGGKEKKRKERGEVEDKK